MNGTSRGRGLTALAAAALAAAAFMWGTFLPALRATTHGFAAYYTASRLMLDGRWSASVYDDVWFGDRVAEYVGGGVREIISPNPPTAAWMMLPFAWLDAAQARAVWLWLSLAWLAAALWLIARAVPLDGLARRAGLVALALACAPVWENFRLAHTYALLLFLLAVAHWALKRGRTTPGGVSLGLAAGLRLSGIPIDLLLAARRQWRAVAIIAVVGLTMAGLSVAWTGADSWAAFLATVPEHAAGRPEWSVTAAQTTGSFFRHLLVADAQWNPQPIADAPGLASALSIAATAAGLGITLWLGRHADFDLSYAAAMSLGVVLLPLAEEYHYMLLVLPLAVMLARVGRRPARPVDAGVFAAAALLLAVPWPYESPRLANGWLSLLAYPRLYGGWLVWGWLIWQMGVTRR